MNTNAGALSASTSLDTATVATVTTGQLLRIPNELLIDLMKNADLMQILWKISKALYSHETISFICAVCTEPLPGRCIQ